MQFTKLRLTGFKSFVDPTELYISEGLIGIVGPNGCGKSNLLEAIRWVMGDNRPSSMRGEGMEDVIFAGAATRPARGFAEVGIQIDNSERLAPQGFNDSERLEVVRRVTRGAGSAYKVNGRDVRARDIQMLFADASSGANSPALVRQGQIAELINAKPTSRRLILEEAAGISGLHQRRHEAELKLKAAEANMLRVEDVVEQLANQLTSLARQARQAVRYREIARELRNAEGLLLYVRWKEANAARADADRELETRSLAAAQAESGARRASALRLRAEEKLPPLRERDAKSASGLYRLRVEHEKIAEQVENEKSRIVAIKSRVFQLEHDIEREAGLRGDAAKTIQKLESELANISRAAKGYDERRSSAAAAAHEAAAALQKREDELSELTEDVARLAARHHSSERLAADCRKTLERAEADVVRSKLEMADEQRKLEGLEAELGKIRIVAETSRGALREAEKSLASTDESRSRIQAGEAEARAIRSNLEGELNALNAEHAAVSRLLKREAGEDGEVLDLIKVAAGHEKALSAALSDDLRAPAVEANGPSGWIGLEGYMHDQPLPDGAAPLSAHVSVPNVLKRRISQIGIVDAAEGGNLQPLLKPGQRLVSLEGDLWRWDGYRTWAEEVESASAIRLEQMNKLEELKQSISATTARAEGVIRAHEEFRGELARLVEADRLARTARKDADNAATEAIRSLSRTEAEHAMAQSKMETLQIAVARYEDEVAGLRETLAEAKNARAALDDLELARAGMEDAKKTVDYARKMMLSRRSANDEIRREGEARARRIQYLDAELKEWRNRLQVADSRHCELADRKTESEMELATALSRPDELAMKRLELSQMIAEAESHRADVADLLSAAEAEARAARNSERDAERDASEAREARARSEVFSESAREALVAAADRISEELQTDPEKLLERFDVDPESVPSTALIEEQLNRLKRQRDSLGAVNLRAEQDAREIDDEHQALLSEKNDLEEAIRALRAGISSLNREGRERLVTAFELVNSNFGMLFKHLFNGGEAKLKMVESDDPLEAGLEILCHPPGKKLASISLLSGGEQTLTALALIFSVFLANPSPICVLDEVDAPLDDANVGRFCDLLDEMRRRTDTRFMIITHHAITMSRMDRLFGVTMSERGVSQLVSVDLNKAEKMVA
ncbi:MAG: AAA family ATPase [Roseovarius sp.]|nr:AAA family ATPase [Roseovarius sp.]